MCSRVSTMSVAAIVSVPTATIHAWMVPGGCGSLRIKATA